MDAPLVWIISLDADTRRLIELNLSKRGLQGVPASTQDELLRSGARPRVIILDVEPPDQPSWGSILALRLSKRLADVPLILMAAAPPPPSQLASLQPARWLGTPMAMDALLTLLQQSLGSASSG